MYLRFDYIQKESLIRRYDTLLGGPFLADFAQFASDHEMPMGAELLIQWQGVRVTAVLFDDDTLLLLSIKRQNGDTPSAPLMVREAPIFPADKKIKSIPKKGERNDKY